MHEEKPMYPLIIQQIATEQIKERQARAASDRFAREAGRRHVRAARTASAAPGHVKHWTRGVAAGLWTRTAP